MLQADGDERHDGKENPQDLAGDGACRGGQEGRHAHEPVPEDARQQHGEPTLDAQLLELHLLADEFGQPLGLLRTDDLSAVDQQANEQRAGGVARVDDGPEPPAAPAEVTRTEEKHLRQQHVDLGEESHAGKYHQRKAGCEAKTEEQPCKAFLLDTNGEDHREHRAECDERTRRKRQRGLLHRLGGEELLRVIDEAEDDLLREPTDIPARLEEDAAVRTERRLAQECAPTRLADADSQRSPRDRARIRVAKGSALPARYRLRI